MKEKVLMVIMSAIILVFCSCGEIDIQSITMTNTDVKMIVGDTITLSYVVEPQNATVKGLTWSSSNENVATVKDGRVKAVSDGDVVITVMTPKGKKTVCNITVDTVPIKAITLSTKSSSIKVGGTVQIDVSVTPATADVDSLEWASSNTDIASVDSNGIVTGLKSGTSVISCMAPSGKKSSCTIVVKATTKKKSSNNSSGNRTTVIVLDPAYIGRTYMDDFVFYDSSYRKISDYEVEGLDHDTVQRAINEIYARNGYVFQTKSIQAFYESTSWYKRNPNFSPNDINSTEWDNVRTFKRYL